jgi:hypothetical protein
LLFCKRFKSLLSHFHQTGIGRKFTFNVYLKRLCDKYLTNYLNTDGGWSDGGWFTLSFLSLEPMKTFVKIKMTSFRCSTIKIIERGRGCRKWGCRFAFKWEYSLKCAIKSILQQKIIIKLLEQMHLYEF